MIVAIFSPNYVTPPVAVYWAEGGELRSDVREDSPETRAALSILLDKVPDVPWETDFVWLSSHGLHTHVWDAFELPEGKTPSQLLDELIAKKKAMLAS